VSVGVISCVSSGKGPVSNEYDNKERKEINKGKRGAETAQNIERLNPLKGIKV